MRQLSVAVVGTGFIGPVHIGALRRLPNVTVSAIVASGEERAREKARVLGVSRAYGDYDEMLADGDIDVVHICSPNHLHASMAKAALKAGKHVVCEKPLANGLAEGRELVDAARASGLVTAVHFNIRYYPIVRQLKTMIARGDLGRILAIHGAYLQDWLLYPTDYNWRLEASMAGTTRAVADIGSHWMDLARYVSGLGVTELLADFSTVHPTRKKPDRPVEAFAETHLSPDEYSDLAIDTEDFASLLLRFEGGIAGALTVSQVAAGRKNRFVIEVDGSKRSAAWNSEHPDELWVGRRDGPNETLSRDPGLFYPEARELVTLPPGHNEGFADTSVQLFRECYEDIRAGGPGAAPKYPTFEDGLRAIRLCDAAFESNRARRWIEVGRGGER